MAKYFVKDKEIFLCDKCIRKTKLKYSEKLTVKEIQGKRFNFLKRGKTFSTFIDFQPISSYNLRYLDELNKIPLNNEFVIFFFPNKKTSNNFSQKMFGRGGSSYIDSRFSILRLDSEKYVLLNYDKLRLEEMPFILKYLDYKLDFMSNNKLEGALIKIYSDILFTYNKRMGINFVNCPEDEEVYIFNFRDEVGSIISDYFALKKLNKKFPKLTLEYITEWINKFGHKLLSYHVSSLPKLIGLIDLIVQSTKLATFRSINKKDRERIDACIYVAFKNLKWGDYSFLDKVLKTYILNFSRKITNIKTHEKLISIISREIHKLIENMPLVFVRFSELAVLAKQSDDILTNLQLFPDMSKYNSSIILKFLTNTKNIQEKTSNPGVKYFLHNTRWFILQQYAIINQDRNMFDIAFKEANKYIDFFKKNINSINKSLVIKLGISDLVLNYNGLAYLFYCFGEINEFNKIRIIIKYLIKDRRVNNPVRVMVYNQNFFLEEDYESLREIHSLYKYPTKNDFKIRLDFIKSSGLFAEAFFSKDINLKLELYSKAIKINEEESVMPSALQKDLSQKRLVHNLYKVFYHMENALNQPNIFFKVSELKKALEYAEEGTKGQKEFENVYYYFYKTKIVHLILQDDLPNIKKNLDMIKRFEFPQSRLFQKFVEDYISICRESLKAKMHFLSNLKDTPDIWIKFIKNYLKDSVNVDYLKEYSRIRSELNKIKDMNQLMLRFKTFVLNDSVTSFWKRKGELNSKAEDIGRSLLLMFLRTLDKFELHKEAQVNFYKMDIIATEKKNINNAFIFETKIYDCPSYYKKGIKQIRDKYFKYKKEIYKNLKAFYVVFDDRKKPKQIRDNVKFGDMKLTILQIPIAPIFSE